MIRIGIRSERSLLLSMKDGSRLFGRCRDSSTCGKVFDVIVVGGGHAGVEACCAASRMGARALLVTHKKETIGEMSCNPSFGGVGKGHLMKEIDALDGVCSRVCDKTGINFRMLNTVKGPAVWGPRAQIDRKLYKREIQDELFTKTPNLEIIYTSVDDLITEGEPCICKGIVTKNGDRIEGKTVVLTTGTFLNGQINIGLNTHPAGRIGDEASVPLAATLKRLNFRMGRLKTGTPPRLKKTTVNFDSCKMQRPDNPPIPFSFMNDQVWIHPDDQVPCYLTQTNPMVGEIIFRNMHLNKHVREEVSGPRYCPSIESKYLRFGCRNHQIWLEPEGLDSDIIYPAGLSCTLPKDLQVELVRQIRGLEEAEIVCPGYGVEYDFIDPRELRPTLETIRIQNLFFAGQINGTTGYEEAAAQGLMAGINAAAKCQNKPEFLLSRSEAYIGVLIDDLTSQGTNEPYRMFTTRAEFRLHLRPDNADLRLTKKGHEIGCVGSERYQKAKKVEETLKSVIWTLKSTVKPLRQWWEKLRDEDSEKPNPTPKSAFQMLCLTKSEYTFEQLRILDESFACLPENRSLCERISIEAVYEGALEAEMVQIEELRKEEALKIPSSLDYGTVSLGLSTEEREKLARARPQTIAAASRIPGITPNALIRLIRFIRKVSRDDTVARRASYSLTGSSREKPKVVFSRDSQPPRISEPARRESSEFAQTESGCDLRPPH